MLQAIPGPLSFAVNSLRCRRSTCTAQGVPTSSASANGWKGTSSRGLPTCFVLSSSCPPRRPSGPPSQQQRLRPAHVQSRTGEHRLSDGLPHQPGPGSGVPAGSANTSINISHSSSSKKGSAGHSTPTTSPAAAAASSSSSVPSLSLDAAVAAELAADEAVAADVPLAQDASGSAPPETLGSAISYFWRKTVALYDFSRPHTMAGTTLSVISVSLLALQGAPLAGSALTGMLTALVSALLMNISIVGINQLSDIEIDKVNKPNLPLASGAMSPGEGTVVVAVATAASLVLGYSDSSSTALLATLVGSLALGIVYSVQLPFLRWKRSPVLAAGCILAVRALLVQLGFYLHMKAAMGALTAWPTAGNAAAAAVTAATGGSALGGAAAATPLANAAVAAAGHSAKTLSPLTSWGSLVAAAGAAAGALAPLLTRPLIFTVVFMLLFSVVIALFKDIPDVKGDMQEGIQTFSVRAGPEAIFWTCIWLLTAAYVGAIVFSFATLPLATAAPQLALSVAGHAGLATIMWTQAKKVDFSKHGHLTAFYMMIWKLFYAEYLLIPALA